MNFYKKYKNIEEKDMSIPILELPQGLSWGTKYKTLYKYFASLKPKNFQKINKLKHHKYFGFYFEAEWKKYKYKVTMSFDVVSEQFTHFDIVIPGIIKNFDIKDFIKTFNLLKNEFGKPDIRRGMSLNKMLLIKPNYFHSKDTEDLPEFVWFIEESEIIHHFINYWGNGPKTTVRKRIKDRGVKPKF